MAEPLHPDITIEGVAISTAAFIGATERGAVEPRLVTSLSDYGRHFGGSAAAGFLPHAVRGFYANGGSKLFVCRVVAPGESTAHVQLGDWSIDAVGPGDWGRRIWVRVRPGSTLRADMTPVGFRIGVAYFPPGQEIYDPFDAANVSRLPRPQYVEDFDDVPFDVSALDSPLITLKASPGASAAPPPFSGLLDGSAEPAVAAQPQGLAALADAACTDVSLIYAPAAGEALQREIVTFCEQKPNRFALLDVAPGVTDLAALHPRSTIADTSFAAFYAPWLWVDDGAAARILVPPGGHVAGMMVRVDRERGAHQAPANEALNGVLGLESAIDDPLQQVLNPRGINAIREFPERGVRVWGARTLSSNPEWKYINVRRFFVFLELSIWQGTRWALFQHNDATLWAKLRAGLESFLNTQWRAGALMGDRADRAYYVRCGLDTMTQSDIDEGRLIVDIGCAPLRPAEFIHIRIVQYLDGS